MTVSEKLGLPTIKLPDDITVGPGSVASRSMISRWLPASVMAPAGEKLPVMRNEPLLDWSVPLANEIVSPEIVEPLSWLMVPEKSEMAASTMNSEPEARIRDENGL